MNSLTVLATFERRASRASPRVWRAGVSGEGGGSRSSSEMELVRVSGIDGEGDLFS